MATNLVDTIQKNLGYPVLQKVDPNIQETPEKSPRQSSQRLAQAAIPAVLTGIYKFSRTDEGCNQLLGETPNEGWLKFIFETKEKGAVDNVALYAGLSAAETESSMEKIASEAISVIKNAVPQPPTCKGMRAYIDTQRHNILVHLPAAMQMGYLLEDDTLDDRTNKMEGPVSGFMHKIESLLSKGDDSKYP
jgi:hypothetical protein